jgi:hypothetical protein
MRVANRDSYPTAAPLSSGTTATLEALKTYADRRLCVAIVAIEDDVGTSDDATNYEEIEDIRTTVGNDMGFSLFTYRKATAGSVAEDSVTVGGSDYWQTFSFALKGPTEVLAGTVAGQSTVTGNLEIVTALPLQGTIAGQGALVGNLVVGPVFEDEGGIAGADLYYVDVPYPSTVNENDILVIVVGNDAADKFVVPGAWGGGANIFPDPSFEDTIGMFRYAGNGAISRVSGEITEYHGDYCIKVVTGDNAYAGITGSQYPIGITGSTQYTFSFYLYNTDDTGVQYDFLVEDQDSNTIAQLSNQGSTLNTWVRHSVTFTTGSDDTGVFLYIRKSNHTDIVMRFNWSLVPRRRALC